MIGSFRENNSNSILNLILEDFPDFDVNDSIAVQELNVYREKYISKFCKPKSVSYQN